MKSSMRTLKGRSETKISCGRLPHVVALSAFLLPFGASPCLAQSDLESLQKEIQQQRLQLEQQNRRLEELERMLREAKAGVAAPGDAAQAQSKTTPAEQEKKDLKGSARSSVLREPDDFYATLRDDSFLKSVPLFGSDWRFSFGGYVKLDVITDFDGTGDRFQFTTATIPVDGASNSPQPGGYTQVHAKESRFNFEVRRDIENAPLTKVFFEMDFWDESSYSPRFRHAYFQYGNLIVGQTWTTLSELRSLPFLIDFAYGDALYGGRTAQVRWQQPVNDRFSWAVALEDYDSGGIENPNALAGTARSWTPLLAARGTYDIGRALFTLGGSLAQLRWDGDSGVSDDQALQWALVFGTRIYLDRNRRHYFGLDASFGDGTARNIISLAEGSVPGAVLGPDGSLHTLYAWSVAPALHFQLTKNISANLAYAWSHVESSSLRMPDEMEGGGAAHVNLIYDLTDRLRFGGEYMIGTRENVNGADGQAQRIQFMSMYSF
jgi:opacity protein-like surface antigen